MSTAAITTTKVGRVLQAVEVVHDHDRCYGFIRCAGTAFKAWRSGNRFDDHFLGEFATRAAAIAAIRATNFEAQQ